MLQCRVCFIVCTLDLSNNLDAGFCAGELRLMCLVVLVKVGVDCRLLGKGDNQRAVNGMVIFGSILVITHDASSDGRKAKKAKSIAAKLPGLSNNRELQDFMMQRLHFLGTVKCMGPSDELCKWLAYSCWTSNMAV